MRVDKKALSVFKMATRSRASLPGTKARAHVLYQNDVGPALIDHNFGVMSSHLTSLSPSFLI